MKILDRYVLFAFVKNYLISFMVLIGLYIVLDMVFNFDELTEIQQSELTGTVRDVKAAGNQLRATITLARDENIPAGAEFNIFDAGKKSVGTLTVDTIAPRSVSGPFVSPIAGSVRAGMIASTSPPGTSPFGVITAIVGYYFYQSFLFFVQLSGIIPVVAAAFTLIRMSRFNEMTAILAAGVPLLRVAMPIVYCGVIINFILLPLNQEIVIPGMIPQLTRKHDELRQSSLKSFPIRAMQDDKDALLNAGRYTPPTETTPAHLDVVDIIERDSELQVSAHIAADSADYDSASASWHLVNGFRIGGLGKNEKQSSPIRVDTWKTNISPEEIALYRSSDFVDLLPTDKINQLLARGKSYGVVSLLRVKHFRWSQLLVNIVLLLLAIPCVLTREPSTLKVDILKCVILTGLCMASIFLARQFAGIPPSGGQLKEQWPLIMAWVPIFIFLPIAIFLLDQKHTKKT